MSSNSLLSWDDLEEDIVPAQPVNPELHQAAAQAIQNIDTAEAVKELDQQFERLKEVKTDASSFKSVNPDFNKIMDKVKQKIVELDQHMEQGGRVDVSEKYLLNCQADLNQLVPFKYGWSWNLYLQACEQHWMPPEFNLIRDREEFQKELKSSYKAIYARAWYNHQAQSLLLPVSTILNIYRIVTNPEYRQYTLRQSFEMCLLNHAWLYITESLVDEETLAIHKVDGKGTLLRSVMANLDYSFRERFDLVRAELKCIHDRDFDTQTPERVGQLLYELIIAFGYVNYLMNIPTYYQLINITRLTGQMNGTAEIIKRMIRDIRTHREALKLLISGIIEENPTAMTDEIRQKLATKFKQFITVELDFISLSTTEHDDFVNIQKLLVTETADLLSCAGIQYDTSGAGRGDPKMFTDLLKALTPVISHDASLGGGKALEF